jgi:hypothetical protein
MPPAPPVSAAPAPTEVPRQSAAASGLDCHASLVEKGIIAEPVAPPPGSEGACTIDDPVRLVRVAAEGAQNGAVSFPDAPVVTCRFAEAFGGWVATLATPLLLGKVGAPLATIRTGPGFECRSRNRVEGGKLSAHGVGIAIDIASFELADKRVLTVKRAEGGANTPAARNEDQALAALRTAACGWFTTILGPGSDPSHADHLHVDVMMHGSNERYRICQ